MIVQTVLTYQCLCVDLTGREMVGPVGVRAQYLDRMAKLFCVGVEAILEIDNMGLISGDRLQGVKLCSQYREPFQKVTQS